MKTIIKHGFKKVFGYSLVKKLLLIGFFLSAIFVTYSVSNIFGLLTISDSEFIKTNKNYLKIERNKIKVDDYLNYENLEGINYLLPGDSKVGMKVSNKEYYQTKESNIVMTGSLSSLDMITSDNLILGRMPENNQEIVIDKMVYKNIEGIEMLGYYDLERMLNVKVTTNKEYLIVGIVDLGSPSIYANKDELLNIIINSIQSDNYNDGMFGRYTTDIAISESSNTLYDYASYKDKITITKGREPNGDYEVIINEKLQDTYKLNKEIDLFNINNHKLVVVGYYKSADDINSYFVNSSTKKYELIEKSKGIIIYPQDKQNTINKFKELGVKVIDVYESDKNDYKRSIKDSVNSSLIVASIMLGISLIEIILMVRSSFLSRIKEVGIYRAIGVKKTDIYKMFTSESIAITTLASLPGVLFMSYCMHILSGISYIGKNYAMNIYIMLLCIILMYLFNIIIGLIPVFNTIRKTPATILSGNNVD